MSGFLTFTMDGREYAAGLDQVREVLRAGPLAAPIGLAGPVVGMLAVRDGALPVVDLRADPATGDVVVVETPTGERHGLAVDRVRAVVEATDLAVMSGAAAAGLPAYVSEVRTASYGLVFVVDLVALLESVGAAAA